MPSFETKDSGSRVHYESGMQRDTQDGKPDFSLLLPDMPYEEQLLTRWAQLMERGAQKYGRDNWQKATSKEELERFKSSALRHMMQFLTDETDEDHAAAVCFNILAMVYLQWKLSQQPDPEPQSNVIALRPSVKVPCGHQGHESLNLLPGECLLLLDTPTAVR